MPEIRSGLLGLICGCNPPEYTFDDLDTERPHQRTYDDDDIELDTLPELDEFLSGFFIAGGTYEI